MIYLEILKWPKNNKDNSLIFKKTNQLYLSQISLSLKYDLWPKTVFKKDT